MGQSNYTRMESIGIAAIICGFGFLVAHELGLLRVARNRIQGSEPVTGQTLQREALVKVSQEAEAALKQLNELEASLGDLKGRIQTHKEAVNRLRASAQTGLAAARTPAATAPDAKEGRSLGSSIRKHKIGAFVIDKLDFDGRAFLRVRRLRDETDFEDLYLRPRGLVYFQELIRAMTSGGYRTLVFATAPGTDAERNARVGVLEQYIREISEGRVAVERIETAAGSITGVDGIEAWIDIPRPEGAAR